MAVWAKRVHDPIRVATSQRTPVWRGSDINRRENGGVPGVQILLEDHLGREVTQRSDATSAAARRACAISAQPVSA